MNRLSQISTERRKKKLFKEKNGKHWINLLGLTARYKQEVAALLETKHSKWLLTHVIIRHRELRRIFKKYNGIWLDYAAQNEQRYTLFKEMVE